MILIHITTVPVTFAFFKGQIQFMKNQGFEIHAVSSPGRKLDETARLEDIPVHAIEMARRITPTADIVSLFKLYRLFRKIRPAIVHAHTPKGGLLGVLAARLAGTPIVIYGMRGLPFVTQSGWQRKILILTETLACRAADRVITVSLATKEKAVEQGFCAAARIVVPGNGSSNGVDAARRFNPNDLTPENQIKVREQYHLPNEATVIGFVGRLVRDKGIVDLAQAWEDLRSRYPDLYLILVGPIEPEDPIPEEVLAKLQSDNRVRFTGQVDDTRPFYAAMDILTLPTHREGFPNTPLEAAAMRLPVVISAVDGCGEAVADGVTGILVPPKNSRALAEALEELVQDQDKRTAMGRAGRERVLEKFKPEIIWQGLFKTYTTLMEEKGLIKRNSPPTA